MGERVVAEVRSQGDGILNSIPKRCQTGEPAWIQFRTVAESPLKITCCKPFSIANSIALLQARASTSSTVVRSAILSDSAPITFPVESLITIHYTDASMRSIHEQSSIEVNFEQRTWWCNNKKTEKSIIQGQNSYVLILSNYYILSEYNNIVLINSFVKSTINMKE